MQENEGGTLMNDKGIMFNDEWDWPLMARMRL